MDRKLKISLIIFVVISLIVASDIGYSFVISGKAVMYPVRHKITCIDSDADEDYPNGLNYLVKGYVQFGNKKTYDKCLGTTTLKEMYCRNTKIYEQPMSKRVNCKYGCFKGACISCGDGICQEAENPITCPADCDRTPPQATVTASPTTIFQGESVIISCTATDERDPNPFTTATVTKPDGTSMPANQFTDTEQTGTYTVTCTATDASGNTATETATFSVLNPCGDGTCADNEDCNSCQADCGECPIIEYKDYKCELKYSIDLMDARHTGGTAEKGIYCSTPQYDGIMLDKNILTNITRDKTREIWIIYSDIERLYDIYYYNLDFKQEYWAGSFDASLEGTPLARINYNNTKGENIVLKTKSLTDNALTLLFDINGKCIPDGSEDIEMLWGLNLQGDIKSLGLTGGGGEAEKAELKLGTQEIGDLTTDYATKYGIIIRNPDSQGANDAVRLSIPNNQLPSC